MLRTGLGRCGVGVSSLTHALLLEGQGEARGSDLGLRGRLWRCGILVVGATASELLAVAGHGQSISRGELESVALVKSRGMGYCTEDPLVIGLLEELALGDRVVPVAELMRRVSKPGAQARKGG